MELIIILVVAVALFWLVRRGMRARRESNPSQPSGRRYVRLDGDGDYELDVVGESNYQDALDEIAGGKTEDGHEFECEATLERERDNPHDANAVAVYIEGQKVGYLGRKHARQLSAILDAKNLDGGIAEAMIVGGWKRNDNDEGHYGVKLDIPV